MAWALVMNDVAYFAYAGKGRFDGDAKPIRTVMQMYPNIYHLVVLKDSSITGVGDIKGKRVSVGAAGSGTEAKTNNVLAALGIKYDDFTVFRLPFAETGSDLRDGRLDLGIWSVAPPTSSIMEITATKPIRIISFTEEEIKKIVAEFPMYSRYELKGVYPGVDPALTLGVWNSVICHQDYPEDYVYDIVKAIFENIDHLIAIHAFARFTTPENTLEHSVFPLHPGVVKYFKEKGLTVPDHLIPPEMK